MFGTKRETAAPIRTFVAFDGRRVAVATPGSRTSRWPTWSRRKVVGRTVAELGAITSRWTSCRVHEAGEAGPAGHSTRMACINIVVVTSPLAIERDHAAGAGWCSRRTARAFPAGQPERRLRARAAGRRRCGVNPRSPSNSRLAGPVAAGQRRRGPRSGGPRLVGRAAAGRPGAAGALRGRSARGVGPRPARRSRRGGRPGWCPGAPPPAGSRAATSGPARTRSVGFPAMAGGRPRRRRAAVSFRGHAPATPSPCPA